ncbi:MAG TPA: DUF309 domain-containing protein [Candidatus Melainabacteria bacterium]|nr:DUF309 domain-containing protein [Candidatus Melainabacteria bacterium]
MSELTEFLGSDLPPHLQAEFRLGIEQYNRREFFECHESLESVWKQYLETDRKLIQGIIQVAVAYYHLERDNFEGCRKLLDRGLGRLRKYRPSHLGLNMENFVAKVEADYRLLESEVCLEKDRFAVPKLQFISRRGDC